MERSGTHLVRWVPLRSTHPTFFVSGIFFILSMVGSATINQTFLCQIEQKFNQDIPDFELRNV
ncbi:Uncharacterized protein dnm_058840 [Desulfonema magnum]|uniref:Uncharacterized protein n=1 Tax=Desulfonema magnum TaxID=45655 RepID=A0A975BQI0_9BACT|nr:Uncharacterized protein dnm_058840 [Desulfonema magnum]